MAFHNDEHNTFPSGGPAVVVRTHTALGQHAHRAQPQTQEDSPACARNPHQQVRRTQTARVMSSQDAGHQEAPMQPQLCAKGCGFFG